MNDETDLWLVQLRKGTLELCMLALLANRERYGYELAQALADSAGLAVGEGTIYPLLSRLQRERLVMAEWRESPAGPPRKYYRLTPMGQAVLANKMQAWEEFSRSVSEILEEARNGQPAG